MRLRIKQLRIDNFKIYKHQDFNFDRADLIVFDGPNGFGKSSLFDAIELLITGVIKRYDRIKGIIDGRETRTENPFYHADTNDGSPIIIRALLEYNGEEIVIARQNTNVNEPKIRFSDYTLHELADFESEPNNANKIGDERMSEILGNNFKNDFEYINYVEQEDTLFYLKSKEADKKNGIDYLFNTGDFNNQIEKYRLINGKLRDLCDGEEGLNSKVISLTKEVSIIEESLKKVESVEHNRLLKHKELDWDQKEINFNLVNYGTLMNAEEGLLIELSNLISNKEDFINSIHNQKIDESLEDEDLLKTFFEYEFFRKDTDQIARERAIQNELKTLQDNFKEFLIDKVLEGGYKLGEHLNEYLIGESLSEKYEQKLKELTTTIRNSNSASKIYTQLMTTRGTLKDHTINYHKEIRDDGTCTFCGFDWKTSEELLIKIEEQKVELEGLNEALDNQLNKEVEEFKKIFNEELNPFVIEKMNDFTFDKDYFKSDFFNGVEVRRHESLKRTFKLVEFDYEKFLLNDVKAEHSAEFDQFKNHLESLKRSFDSDKIEYYFEDHFEELFDSKKEYLEEVTLDDLNQKKGYIEWLYSINQSKIVRDTKLEITKLNEKLEKLRIPRENLSKIQNSLESSLKWYNNELIKDIELLLHVYTGRIVQDFQGGLGLFIVNKSDKIKFVTSPNKTYDAVFSMSTGQLSALAIAFTLALNKKYTRSKLLFIDDPVQSMDDLNTAGFVEVLRNDFKDRQIILSTHEHMMSTYVRYKFKKFGLNTDRVDLSTLN